MPKLSSLARRPLKWVQPKMLKMEYELQDDGRLVATVIFRSMFGSLATASSDDGAWTFKRTGFFHPVVTVRLEGKEKDIAFFRNNTWSRGGTLELADGRKYLASTNFWATTYEFTTEAGEHLISFTRVGGVLHMSTDVEIHRAAAHMPEMPWIVMLGWYLIVLMHRDHAAGAM